LAVVKYWPKKNGDDNNYFCHDNEFSRPVNTDHGLNTFRTTGKNGVVLLDD